MIGFETISCLSSSPIQFRSPLRTRAFSEAKASQECGAAVEKKHRADQRRLLAGRRDSIVFDVTHYTP
jgi:hypothetical protein